MNKRITSLLLCFVMVFTMLVTAVPVFAEPSSSCTYTIEADKTEASPGDEIVFTLYVKQTGKLNTMGAELVVPTGLTYVANSATITDGINDVLNWTTAMEGISWTEAAMLVGGVGSISYEGTEKLELMKFKCTVDNSATVGDLSLIHI